MLNRIIHHITLIALLPLLNCCTHISDTDQSAELTPVVMQFDWIFNAQFAGFYQAIEQGFYEDAGLLVTLRGGLTTPNSIEAALEEPMISFGSAESNTLLVNAVSGSDVKVIATMFQDSPMGWMYLPKSGIESFEDLALKRVGVHPDGEKVIQLLLQKVGADLRNFEMIKVSYEATEVIEGNVDAMQCYYIDEYVQLNLLTKNQGKIFLARDYGYKAYSQVIFTHSDTIEKHPDIVKRFLEATKQGWQYAFEHKSETVDLIIDTYNPELERDYQLKSLAKIEELMIPEPGALFRAMDPAVWTEGQASLLSQGLLSKAVSIEGLLDQRFLPSE